MTPAERLKRGECPHCGTALVVILGLAGDGYGAYTYCPDDKCGKYFHKTRERDAPLSQEKQP